MSSFSANFVLELDYVWSSPYQNVLVTIQVRAPGVTWKSKHSVPRDWEKGGEGTLMPFWYTPTVALTWSRDRMNAIFRPNTGDKQETRVVTGIIYARRVLKTVFPGSPRPDFSFFACDVQSAASLEVTFFVASSLKTKKAESVGEHGLHLHETFVWGCVFDCPTLSTKLEDGCCASSGEFYSCLTRCSPAISDS